MLPQANIFEYKYFMKMFYVFAIVYWFYISIFNNQVITHKVKKHIYILSGLLMV